MIKAVLFDLDGTLINTLDDIADSVNFILCKYGHPIHKNEEYKYFAGCGNEIMIKRALPEKYRQDREYVLKIRDEFFERYGEHCTDKSYVYEGIYELINSLKKMDIMVAVVTNKSQKMTDITLPKYFKTGTFSAVIGQRDGVPTKPEPHMPFLAMTEMEVNPDECIFVGDSYNDIEAGLNSGNTPVGVLWGFRDKKELSDAGARYIVENPMEIVKIIEEING